MRRVLFISLLGLFVLGADGRSDGRRGNAAYDEGAYDAAAEAYRRGLERTAPDASWRVRFGLANNLGASQYRLDQPSDAATSFEAAARAAESPREQAVARYNAGNAAFKSQDLERALQQYRAALLADPNDLHAKYNFEFVKRQLQEQEQEGGQDQDQNEDQKDEQQDQEQGEGENDQQEGSEQEEDEGDGQDQDQEPQRGEDQQQDDQRGDGSSEADESQMEDEREGDGGAQQQDQDLRREQAERILQALENDEAELLREVQRMQSPPRRVEKDW